MKSFKDFEYKKILSLFLQQERRPYFNAKGIAVGVFSGCFPFFGFQTLLGLFLARVTKGNLILAALGTWISNPFTYVPLYLFNYKIGSVLITNSSDIIIDRNLLNNDLWEQGKLISFRLILGSSLVGLFLGLISGVLAYYFYKKNKRQKI